MTTSSRRPWHKLGCVLTVSTFLGCATSAPKVASRPAPPTPVAVDPTSQPSGIGLASYKVSPSYEKAIATFESVATTRPSPVGGTVFIGSSSFTKWKTLERDMAAFKAVNRGFGGSRTDDVLYYARRILEPLHPTRVVYYCGSNDLASKRPAETVIANFKTFVDMARQVSPGVAIYFVAENTSPKRAMFAAGFDLANKAVQAWAAKTSGVYFIDARPGLFDENGNAIPSLFQKDGVHLNDAGYKIWAANIAKGLEGERAER